jgi:hypothetical protein
MSTPLFIVMNKTLSCNDQQNVYLYVLALNENVLIEFIYDSENEHVIFNTPIFIDGM